MGARERSRGLKEKDGLRNLERYGRNERGSRLKKMKSNSKINVKMKIGIGDKRE